MEALQFLVESAIPPIKIDHYFCASIVSDNIIVSIILGVAVIDLVGVGSRKTY